MANNIIDGCSLSNEVHCEILLKKMYVLAIHNEYPIILITYVYEQYIILLHARPKNQFLNLKREYRSHQKVRKQVCT